MSDPTGLLMQMFDRSSRKLNDPKNLAKESWYEMTDLDVFWRLMDELDELRSAMNDVILGTGTWDTLADEAADVYHFASMGADPRRKEIANGS